MYINWKMALEKWYWQQKKKTQSQLLLSVKKILQIESEKWFLESCDT